MARKRSNTPALPPPPPPLEPGDEIGSYRIVRLLGEGGMGRVYEADHTLLDKKAAIKVLLPELATNPEAIRRFVNEGRAASAIKHPNIVTVHECARRPDGQWFIVLEFVEGGSLGRRMRTTGGPMEPGDVVSIVGQTASALHAAHKRSIVHRDIKPENIQLTQSPTNPNDDIVTVLDFGVAKMAPTAGGVGTRSGTALGTPRYMAPETLRGAPADFSVDVYALGVVAWEMLTGEELWTGAEPGAIMEQQVKGARPLDPCAVKGHIPAAMGAAVARALSFDRERRWPSVQAFALALAHGYVSEWGTGIEIIRRVANDITVLPSEAIDTAGRALPPPLAPTLRVVTTAPASTPGAVPIVATAEPGAVPIVTLGAGVVPQALATPPPAQPGRVDAPTIPISGPGTVSLAVNVSQSPITAAEPIRMRRMRQRRALWWAVAAASIVAIGVAVAVTRGGAGTDRGAAPSAAPSVSSSAIAIVSDPPGASIAVDGSARGIAPINVAAPIGSAIEIRAELADHAITTQRVTVGAEPATVRVSLAPLASPVDAGTVPADAGAMLAAPTRIDAAPTRDDASTRSRKRRTDPSAGGGIDQDGLVDP